MDEADPIRVAVRAMRGQFCAAARAGRFGQVAMFEPRVLVNNTAYERRRELLEYCDRAAHETFDRDTPRLGLFHELRGRGLGVEDARARCRHYRDLLGEIRKSYRHQRTDLPVIVMDGTRYVRRLDGTHRICIFRYLGYQRIYVLVVEPEEYRQFAVAHLPQQQIERRMRQWAKWYQSIEVLPRLWTRPPRANKEGTMIAAMKALTWQDRHVVDLGCNAGLYSLMAGRLGARNVLGVDKRRYVIDQADFVQTLWDVQFEGVRMAKFRCADARSQPDLFEGRDTLIAACVLYHLREGLHPVMARAAAGGIRRMILQGNTGRRAKCPAELLRETERKGVTAKTPAQAIFDQAGLTQLLKVYGYRPILERPGCYPVVVGEK